jgi:hypothetical protein
MTRTFTSTVIILVASVLLAAQSPSYDRAKEKTYAGSIKAVVSYTAPDGTVGVHFDLRTPDGMVNVHVAPAVYIGLQNFWFFADDELQIIGAPVFFDGRTTIYAKAIMKGTSMLVLRNDDGSPKWTPAIDGTDGCGVLHAPLPRSTEY